MNNYRNNRKNRFKSSGDRSFRKRPLNGHKNQNDFNNHSEFRHRNPGRNNQNAAKLIEKYSFQYSTWPWPWPWPWSHSYCRKI